MTAPKTTKRGAPDRATRDGKSEPFNRSATSSTGQHDKVRRLRLAAQRLALSAAFVSDFPLTVELFDSRGHHAETLVWP